MRENQNGNKKQTLPKTSFNYLHSIIFISQAKNRLQNPRAYEGGGNAACGMHPTTLQNISTVRPSKKLVKRSRALLSPIGNNTINNT